MAWLRNKQSDITLDDLSGTLGGFGRATGNADETFIGPLYSQDGTAWYITVTNLGQIVVAQAKP